MEKKICILAIQASQSRKEGMQLTNLLMEMTELMCAEFKPIHLQEGFSSLKDRQGAYNDMA